MERLKRMVVTALILFSGTLSALLIKELSADALAMLLGVACGMLASLPLLVALLFWSSRSQRNERREPAARPQHETHQPPVIVIAGAGAPSAPPWVNGRAWLPPASQALGLGSPSLRVLGEPMAESWVGDHGSGGNAETERWSWEGEERW
ncbi:MAG: hypothetical protein GX605_03900 [Chloroflexi bacterium]|nr:hypothetical protein [Chloroflexota bacterium]